MDNGRHTKKTWIPTAVSSTNRGSRIAQKNRTDNAKPTPNIKYTLVLHTIINGTHMRVHIQHEQRT